MAIAEKVIEDDDEENPVKYLATNKIDAPSDHIIRTYSYRWRIETFFEDSKQDFGLGDCEVCDSDGASDDWHRQMLTYSLLRLDPESSAGRDSSRKPRLSVHSSNTVSKKQSTICFRGSATNQTGILMD